MYQKTLFHISFLNDDLDSENTLVSIKDLLKQELMAIFNLYLRSYNLLLDSQFVSTALEPKIAFLESGIEPISSNLNLNGVLLTSQLTPIVYRCSIALALATHVETTPKTIASEFVSLIHFEGKNNTALKSSFNLCVEITESGWMVFYLDSQSLASWLQQLLIFQSNINVLKRHDFVVFQPAPSPTNLFFIQYIHARCCSLLRLAAREKLIVLRSPDSSNLVWQLLQPSISWLNPQNNLWLEDEIELQLIFQLLVVIDSFNNKSIGWVKLAVDFSHTMAIFFTECRFLGETRQRYPDKAIARIGLIAIARYWLHRILIEKLNIEAPTSL